MSKLTIEQALTIPQANYLTFQASGIKADDVVSASMHALIVANRMSWLPILHTQGFGPCMCIMVENKNTGTMFLTHLYEYKTEALEQMIQSARRSPRDTLEVHMIGAFCDANEEKDQKAQRQEWYEEMQPLIDVINRHANVQLKTFDVGEKPHPVSVAFFKDSQGETRLVRGSTDYTTCEQMQNPTRTQDREDAQLDGFRTIEEPSLPDNFQPTAENPFSLVLDGRLAMNQDSKKAQTTKNAQANAPRDR